jgi:hypothetical protein
MGISAEILVRPRRTSTGRVTVLIVLVLVVGVPAWGVYALYAHQEALRRYWGGIRGPACPMATHAWAQVAGTRTPHQVAYAKTAYRYVFGAADCTSVPDGRFITMDAYYVCQFTRPLMLEVTAAGRTVRYEPGWGRRATVSIRRGQPNCVIGGWSNPDDR